MNHDTARSAGSFTTGRAAAMLCAILLAGALLPLATVPVPGARADAGPVTSCEDHAPIVVQGNAGPTGFALVPVGPLAELTHNPAAGVTGGTGAADDPYIIEGWCLTGTLATPAIRISDTTAHVTVRDNLITGDPGAAAVLLDAAANVVLTGNEIASAGPGIEVMGGSDHRITDNLFHDNALAVRLGPGGSPQVDAVEALLGAPVPAGLPTVVETNVIQDGPDGVLAAGASDVTVRANTFSSVSFPIALDGATGVLVADHTIAAPTVGIKVIGGGSNTVTGNTITNCFTGILLLSTAANTLAGNEVSACSTGLVGDASQGDTLTGNTLDSNTNNLRMRGSTQYVLRDNVLTGAAVNIDDDRRFAFAHDIDTSNSVNGRPILYVVGGTGQDVTGAYGQVILVDTTGTTVHDLTGLAGRDQFRAAFTTDLVVEDNTFAGGTFGAAVIGPGSNGTVLRHNTITGPSGTGFVVEGQSRDTLIHDNAFDGTLHIGIALGDASRGTIIRNHTVTGGSMTFITVTLEPTDVLVHNNTFVGSGTFLNAFQAGNVTLLGNQVSNNFAGVWFFSGGTVVANWNNFGHNLNDHHVSARAGFPTPDMRHNWWGCATGPGPGFTCDGVNTPSLTSPWATSPLTNVGAP